MSIARSLFTEKESPRVSESILPGNERSHMIKGTGGVRIKHGHTQVPIASEPRVLSLRMSKKRVTKKAQETQRRILSSALTLFREKGFDKTSMRDIAEAADVAVGASYYYYSTKEELVLAYYEDACSRDAEFAEQLAGKVTGFKERFSLFLQYKISQLSENRGFMNILARSAANPEDPLSPFGPQTKHIRDDAMHLLSTLVAGSDLKTSERFKPYLPGLLWLHMMGTIFFWIHDRSNGQRVTTKVIEYSVGLVSQLLWLSSLPLTDPINKIALRLFDLVIESQKSEEGVAQANP
jgi:AcrR family transcriptional regulator